MWPRLLVTRRTSPRTKSWLAHPGVILIYGIYSLKMHGKARDRCSRWLGFCVNTLDGRKSKRLMCVVSRDHSSWMFYVWLKHDEQKNKKKMCNKSQSSFIKYHFYNTILWIPHFKRVRTTTIPITSTRQLQVYFIEKLWLFYSIRFEQGLFFLFSLLIVLEDKKFSMVPLQAKRIKQ